MYSGRCLKEHFLFHGSPDMIQTRPISVKQNLITGCIETKLNKRKPYKSNSIILEEAGQLMAYIHQMMIAFALKKLMICAH